jgi:predicted O-methyltransferase YrrM
VRLRWGTPPIRRWADQARHLRRRQLGEARWLAGLIVLPIGVARFQLRARRLARRSADQFSLSSVTRPRDLRTLLSLARGAGRVVELGTATGWTAISLALADPARQVISYDVVQRSEPLLYMTLVSGPVRERIELMIGAGSDGPGDQRLVDLLYIDSSHEREQTIAEVLAWRPVLRRGATIVFDDYTHPDYPGIREAIAELGLGGRQHGTLFVHDVP